MRMNVVVAFFVLIFATLANAFQSHPEWVKYTSAEGRYSASLPGEPTLKTQETVNKDQEYVAMSVDGNGVFMIIYVDFPRGAASFEQTRDGILSKFNGTLLSEESVSHDGLNGKQIKMLIKASGIDFIARMQFYDVDKRSYQLMCMFPKSEDGPVVAENARKFFDSFKVTSR